MNIQRLLTSSLFCLFLIASSFKQQTISSGNLHVTVTGIKNSEGEIELALFNRSEGFPGEVTKAYKSIRRKITNGTCNVSLENIPFGIYAVAIFHDENNNQVFDETWYGMPKEGVAVSNNPNLGMFSPPDFQTAKFIFDATKNTISIKIKYL